MSAHTTTQSNFIYLCVHYIVNTKLYEYGGAFYHLEDKKKLSKGLEELIQYKPYIFICFVYEWALKNDVLLD